MKKIISIILVMMCILTSITTINADEVNASEKTLSFSDVKTTHWFYNNVTEMIELGIVNGYEDGTFRPQGEIKADEFIKMVLVAMGYEPCQSDSTYWADGYITKAEELKIVDKTFINDYRYNLTREQASRIIVNALSLKETKPVDTYNDYIKTAINDYHLIADKYKQDVIDCYALGIMQGDTNKNINPKQTITRAEATTVILRMINKDIRLKLDDITSNSKNIILVDAEGVEHEIVAPMLNGEPVQEIIEVAKLYNEASKNTNGIDAFGYNFYSNYIGVTGFENQRKVEYLETLKAKTELSNEELTKMAMYMDFNFGIDLLELKGKYVPYTFIGWKNISWVDDVKYKNQGSKWGQYFTEYYLDSFEPVFKYLFEDDFNEAWGYFTTAINCTGEYKGITVILNERCLDMGYHSGGIQMTITLKNQYK